VSICPPSIYVPYSVSLQLPWPPSVNHYWRHVGRVTKISAEGREFREAVKSLVARRQCDKCEGRLAVHVTAYPPDRRRRDIDNLNKALLDGLQYAGLYDDDGQIDWLLIERAEIKPGGCVEVDIREVSETFFATLSHALKSWWASWK
jgi:crossover junction endodeoxyribonuclease RusA